ncbi:bacterial regulatory s, gntR family protein [Yersinia rohdei]|uniref:Bacterial regulatory s, gntR family protein n=1 Tax=Yersinia rohdei TaxID=29485 RepID=A0A0U1HMY7_YERRO|nr:FCD domain-containing protein [Yersinia rohdei]AJJ12314.1 bacterial regulatory s, gntR family protein [Yersinia rohdei]EEQ04680.1 Uxu operon transcriptional regulator [Yersinia rohdei ATCC 43380]MDN0093504.1 FCD domain-containing protein [Yersinia rohdei]OWF81056.1 GntR family transcriptional regulator [Yersinia rohdei]CNE21189.1 DNA-binding transcriptional repressor [Yersinia rohdei]
MTQLTEPKRPYQEVGHALRQMINRMNSAVGDKLPPEREIAQMLDVSRAVVREALIMLELEKLIEVRKGSGIYIIALPDQKHSMDNADVQNAAGPFELLQARQLLESNIAEFAATQATPADIANMRRALSCERDELKTDEDETGDREFHLAIAQATHNSMLVELLKQSWAWRENNPMWLTLHTRITTKGYRKEWMTDHQLILAAMIKKDPAAAKAAMWQHLENVKQRLLALSDVDDPYFDGYLFNSYPVYLVRN